MVRLAGLECAHCVVAQPGDLAAAGVGRVELALRGGAEVALASEAPGLELRSAVGGCLAEGDVWTKVMGLVLGRDWRAKGGLVGNY